MPAITYRMASILELGKATVRTSNGARDLPARAIQYLTQSAALAHHVVRAVWADLALMPVGPAWACTGKSTRDAVALALVLPAWGGHKIPARGDVPLEGRVNELADGRIIATAIASKRGSEARRSLNGRKMRRVKGAHDAHVSRKTRVIVVRHNKIL